MLPIKTTVGIQMCKRTIGYDISDTMEIKDYAIGHYITITGIFIDEQINKRWLRVQSWGEEYYIDFDGFYDYNTDESGRLGTIIVVE